MSPTRSAQEKSLLGGMSAQAKAAGAGPGAEAGGMMTGADGEGLGVGLGEVPGGQRLQEAAQNPPAGAPSLNMNVASQALKALCSKRN